MVHSIYDSETLKKATNAYFQKDWAAMLEINLSMLDAHPNDEFLLWHIADNYVKLGDASKAVEFAGRIKESVVHRDDIMLRVSQMAQPEVEDE